MEERRAQICGKKAGFESGSDSTQKGASRRGPCAEWEGGSPSQKTVGRGPPQSGGREGAHGEGRDVSSTAEGRELPVQESGPPH